MSILQSLLAASQTAPLTANELGQLADFYHSTRIKRLAADKVAAALKTDESGAESLLIEQMHSQEITAAGGKFLRVGLSEPDYVPAVKDWGKYYEFIKQNDAFELLERRPGKAACRERWDNGIDIPGVEKFPVYKLTRNEVK
jgi:hypothetical protein